MRAALLLAAFALAGCRSTAAPFTPAEAETRIAVGSCAHQDEAQPIWDTILRARPDAFLFIGDNVYADTDDPKKMAAAYAKLGAIPEFARFRDRVPILPTWDDHDYGANDAGAENPIKVDAQRIFLDFFAVPEDDPRRRREGVYFARVLGAPGRQVQVILLDTRYFRSPLRPRPGGDDPVEGRYVPEDDPAATMLGEAQWAWLAEQLEVPAEIRIIASSVQVVSEDHGWEKWMNLPRERARLFALLVEKKASGVIFVSGDRHKAELSMMDAGIGYPTYDLTASGLNQGFPRWFWFEENRHRVAVMRWGDTFGLIRVDWDREDPVIRFETRFEDGETAFSHRVRLSTLQPGALPPR